MVRIFYGILRNYTPHTYSWVEHFQLAVARVYHILDAVHCQPHTSGGPFPLAGKSSPASQSAAVSRSGARPAAAPLHPPPAPSPYG